MFKRIVLTTLLVGMLILSSAMVPVSLAQDNWTCDNGPHDVLNAAQAAYNKGDLTTALTLAQTAEKVCGNSNPLRAKQVSLWLTLIQRALRPTAVPVQTTAVPQRLLNLSQQGGVAYGLGQLALALNLYQQAFAVAQQLGNRRYEGTLLSNIGKVYETQGQYAQALDTLTQALAIRREVGDRAGEGITLSNIALVYRYQGQYAQALDTYIQAFAIEREVGDRADEGVTLSNIGVVYEDQGQYAKALDTYTQALAVRREVGDRVGEGVTLSNIGALYEEQGQYAKALDTYTQALAVRREVGDQVGEGATLSNMGALYEAQGQYAQALDTYTQALAIAREVGDRADEGAMLSGIGMVYETQGQYAQALNTLTQALAIVREVGDRAHETVILDDRGFAYEKLGQRDKALDDYRNAVDSAEATLDAAALDSAIASLAGQRQNTSPYQRLAVLLAQDGQASDALNYTERGRAILIRTELSGKPIDFRANADQSALQREADLLAAVNSAQKVLDSLHKDPSASATTIQQAQTVLDQARSDYQQQLDIMQLHGGFLARQIARTAAPLDQIQAAIPADTTLVLYAFGNIDSVVFLVTNKTLYAVVLNVTSAQITEQVTAFASDRHANISALGKVYDLVIAPIAAQLTTTHLIIAPDGALNYVPFAALQAPDGHYLIDHYAISYIPSATTLVLLKNARGSGTPSSSGLVLAQPVAPGMPRLINSRAEASSIAQTLGVTPLLDASPTDLRSQSTGARVITISAHAELDAYAPLFSTIYLKADAQSDGRFEARQVYELNLTQTDLVVLSGCNTASGGNGEDFGVLTRAFFAAGTPRVVASLWSVDDQATALLIPTYMAERAHFSNEADALRAAMLKVRQTYPEPYDWASFVLSGLSSSDQVSRVF